MSWMEEYNKVISYVEEHLDEEIDNKEIAGMVGTSPYHFQRFFMMVTGVPFIEYVSSRKLAKAAGEMQAMLTIPITENAAATLECHVEEKEAFRVVGLKIPINTAPGQKHQDIGTIWGELMESGKYKDIMELMNQEPYGVLCLSDYDPELSKADFDYYIACASDVEVPESMAEFTVPAITWAVCACESVETLPRLRQQMIREWLSTSGYEFANAPDVEYYNADGTVEAWLPVVKR